MVAKQRLGLRGTQCVTFLVIDHTSILRILCYRPFVYILRICYYKPYVYNKLLYVIEQTVIIVRNLGCVLHVRTTAVLRVPSSYSVYIPHTPCTFPVLRGVQPCILCTGTFLTLCVFNQRYNGIISCVYQYECAQWIGLLEQVQLEIKSHSCSMQALL